MFRRFGDAGSSIFNNIVFSASSSDFKIDRLIEINELLRSFKVV